MSWHVTPEPEHNGFGTKVGVIGQWIGSEGEYELVIEDFEKVLKANGVGDFQRGQQSLSKCLNLGLCGRDQGVTESAYLQSMHKVFGNRTASSERGTFDINEHVDSYAKASREPEACHYRPFQAQTDVDP
jgi:hypothetical protein